MRRARYEFVSEWTAAADPADVWPALLAIGSPTGAAAWPGARIAMPPEPRVGDEVVFDVRSGIGYRLRFTAELTAVETGRLLVGRALGDLDGTGELRLTSTAGGTGTLVRIRWAVATDRAWMNLLARPLGPAFRAAHDRVMRRGGAALARAVDAS